MTEHHVFGHREAIHQAKVLVHHGDAVSQTITRAVESNLFAVSHHLPSFGSIQTTQHRRQRALTRPVFAQQRVHLTTRQIKIHLIISNDPRKPFGHPSCGKG